MHVLPLRGAIQHYPWGSRTALAEWRGQEPGPEPEAELWLGAHPRGPARVEIDGRDVPLAALIERDPEAVLGPRVVARFGARLPFLMKVLTVAEPLSIQAHPGAAQARAGFEREEAAGIPPDAPERCYPDPEPKPEIVCALRPFTALCGFRQPREITAALGRVGAAELAPPVEAEGAALLHFFRGWFEQAPAARAAVLERVVSRARRAERGGEADPDLAWVARLAELHPGDPGVLGPLFLNRIELAPGQALFLGPGVPHAYLAGFAVEVMASSDNVLRAGLSRKHVDAAELARILRFEASQPPVLEPTPRALGVATYRTPADAFELSVLEVGAGGLRLAGGEGVAVLLCTEGGVRVGDEGQAGFISLAPGEACLVPDAAVACRLEGRGRVHRAAVPLDGA